MAAFSDEELTTFCYDFFRPVYEQFASRHVPSPIKFTGFWRNARNKDARRQLLARVKEANPYQYARFAGRLVN